MKFATGKQGFHRKGVAFKQSFRHESATWEERHEDEDSGFSGMFNTFSHQNILLSVIPIKLHSKLSGL